MEDSKEREYTEKIEENGLYAVLMSAKTHTGKVFYGASIYHKKIFINYVPFGDLEKEPLKKYVVQKMRNTVYQVEEDGSVLANGFHYR